MKQLMILRHAKSDWGNEGLRDIDRHLNERGYLNAYLMSQWFADNHPAPELIISSTATRALNTALIFSRTLKLEIERFVLTPAIYEARRDSLKEIIATQDDQVNNILMVGHNPGLTDLCNALSEELFFDNLPTCGLVNFSCNTESWRSVADGRWPINFYKFPKDYKNQS